MSGPKDHEDPTKQRAQDDDPDPARDDPVAEAAEDEGAEPGDDAHWARSPGEG